MINKKHILLSTAVMSILTLTACNNPQSNQLNSNTVHNQIKQEKSMNNQQKVIDLLNSLQSGDQAPVAYINPEHYTQHNLMVGDGLAGFGEIVKHAPEGGFGVDIKRAFNDGEYVFTHTQYDFFGDKVGFDIFRFENGKIVEHWDNLATLTPPNPSGHTQIDGVVQVTDLDKTEENKQIVAHFAEDILSNHQMQKITTYINPQKYIQHNSMIADGLDGFGQAMEKMQAQGMIMQYDNVHKILGQGNFVLMVSEGKFGKNGGEPVAYYDLFRLENGKIVEHWDTIEVIPPRSEWKNDNGKFGFQ